MSTSYTVTATRLYVRQEDGTDKRYDRGDSVSGLSSEDVERFKVAGAIASGGSDEAKAAKDAPVDPDVPELTVPTPTGITVPQASEIVADVNSSVAVRRPPRAGTKEAWADYAVASGQLSEDDAKKRTRDQLRDELN